MAPVTGTSVDWEPGLDGREPAELGLVSLRPLHTTARLLGSPQKRKELKESDPCPCLQGAVPDKGRVELPAEPGLAGGQCALLHVAP